jgi:hypothetical protein
LVAISIDRSVLHRGLREHKERGSKINNTPVEQHLPSTHNHMDLFHREPSTVEVGERVGGLTAPYNVGNGVLATSMYFDEVYFLRTPCNCAVVAPANTE